VLLQYELQFQSWIGDLLQQRTGLVIDFQRWKRSLNYRYNMLFIIQMVSSDTEFQSIILIADNYCECTENYYCFYCMLYDITQPMTTSAYIDSELLDLEQLQQLN